MTSRQHRVACQIATLSIALLSTACQPQTPTMTPEETLRIQALTSQMTTRCVGRYLMDVPKAFGVNVVSRTEIEGVRIDVTPMDKKDFDAQLALRHTVLKHEKLYGEETPSLLSVTNLKLGEGVVFDRSRAQTSAVLRTLELMAFANGYAITMQVDSRDMRFAEPDPSETIKTNTPEKLALLLSVYERTSGRKDDEIPTGQGVCFANGFTAGPPTDTALITMAHDWREVDDVYFSYSYSNTLGKEDTTLLERANSSAVKKLLAESNGKILRATTRQQHGMEFEEWIRQNEYKPVQDYTRKLRVTSYSCALELNTLHGNAEKPFMALDFTSGFWKPRPDLSLEESAVDKPITKSSLSAAEAVALWDKVTATLRPRPGAF